MNLGVIVVGEAGVSLQTIHMHPGYNHAYTNHKSGELFDCEEAQPVQPGNQKGGTCYTIGYFPHCNCIADDVTAAVH